RSRRTTGSCTRRTSATATSARSRSTATVWRSRRTPPAPRFRETARSGRSVATSAAGRATAGSPRTAPTCTRSTETLRSSSATPRSGTVRSARSPAWRFPTTARRAWRDSEVRGGTCDALVGREAPAVDGLLPHRRGRGGTRESDRGSLSALPGSRDVPTGGTRGHRRGRARQHVWWRGRRRSAPLFGVRARPLVDSGDVTGGGTHLPGPRRARAHLDPAHRVEDRATSLVPAGDDRVRRGPREARYADLLVLGRGGTRSRVDRPGPNGARRGGGRRTHQRQLASGKRRKTGVGGHLPHHRRWVSAP